MNRVLNLNPISTQGSVRSTARLGAILGALICLLSVVAQAAGYVPSPTVAAQLTQSLLQSSVWFSIESDSTLSVAWGDVDGDGDLDLAVGNWRGPVRLYRNDEGGLSPAAVWSSIETDEARSVAWGDVDGDGDLDLAVGNDTGTANRLYRNDGSMLSTSAIWSSQEEDSTWSVAWGDADGDGDLDLLTGNWGNQNRLYLNTNGVLSPTASWASVEVDETTSVAWGDVDGDGDLDLVAGSHNTPNRLYRNTGGVLETTASWSSAEADLTWNVALGDMDGDGDLDLAVANDGYDSVNNRFIGAPNRIYRNEGGSFSPTATWNSTEADATLSLAWGDVDGDSDLDLAVGNRKGTPNRIYLNESGALSTTPFWSSVDSEEARSIAWGDVDGDHDLDLALGNDFGDPNRLYINHGVSLAETADWVGSEPGGVLSVAWGDVDGDGDLDLAVGTVDGSPSYLYLNQNGRLSGTAAWRSVETNETRSLAWGDVDGDGDLDLAVGNDFPTKNYLYRNDNGLLTTTPTWFSNEAESTLSVAWGDADGDGDLDLAVGNWQAPNRLYRNDGGTLTAAPIWSSLEADETLSVAWGDVDNDGDLDLAAGNWNTANRLYTNSLTGLSTAATWSSDESDETTSVAWGDVDGDGDEDLAVGNRNSPNRIYLNQAGHLSASADWSSNESDSTFSVAWGDVDGDGDLDLAVGNGIRNFEPTNDVGAANRLYLNRGGMLLRSAVWTSTNADATWSVAWGDVDGDGDLDLAAGNRDNNVAQIYYNQRGLQSTYADVATIRIGSGQSANGISPQAAFYTSPLIHSEGLIRIPVTLTLPQRHEGYTVVATYALDGGGHWRPAVGTIVGNEYHWNVYGSGFFGQSDNVVLRLAVKWACTNSCLRPAVATQSFPLRVRGTQIYVQQQTNNGMQPVAAAAIYRILNGQNGNGQPFTDVDGNLLLTDNSGFLQGRGSFNPGDYLFAMAPIERAEKYVVYQTSARPGVEGFSPTGATVNGTGVQTLTVSTANPLILFNLGISLEWDARYDAAYLRQLNSKIQRAAELLYDWTNGQVALGDITIYQDGEGWAEADVQIHVNNQLRPHATIGGIVRRLTLDTIIISPNGQAVTVSHLYQPGHVAMGAVWNRYGEEGEQLSEDWERTLAHELGHYLLYLHDNYVGLDADNQIIRVDGCPGVMSNPYLEILSEFHPANGWIDRCASTFSHQILGQHDWATIRHHYPWLYEPTGVIDDPQHSGPNLLPLAVTRIHYVEPGNSDRFIDVPTYPVVKSDGSRYLASPQAQAYLFHDHHLVNLGAPENGNVLGRGARPGDTICIYDLAVRQSDGAATPLTGCQSVQTGGEPIKLATPPAGWQPDVVITPGSAQMLTIAVGNVTASPLALEAAIYSQEGEPLAMTALSFDSQRQQHEGLITLTEPARSAYLHIREASNWTRGVIMNYNLAGSSALLLGEGNDVALSVGSTLTPTGQVPIHLQNGDLLTIRRGLVQLRYNDGTIAALRDGESLQLTAGGALIHPGSSDLALASGDRLTVEGNSVKLEQPDKAPTPLLPGDILKLDNGVGIILPDDNLRAVIWFGPGEVHSMSEGDVLSMSEGDTLSVGLGGVPSMSEGDIIRIVAGGIYLMTDSEIPLVGGGNATYFGEGSAPIRSSDGNVSIYGRSLSFSNGEFYTVQPASIIPERPLWATAIGKGYRVTKTPGAPDLAGLSISMNYIGRTIAEDKETLLTIYYWDPTLSPGQRKWQALSSKVDTEHNFVTARAAGAGVYLLMYSYDIPLSGKGWSLFSYPVLGSRPIPAALSSIDPYYTIVYHYNALEPDLFKQWRVFAKPPVPAWVSTLHDLEFGMIYLINAGHTSTLTIKFADEGSARVRTSYPVEPPATYYGYLSPSASFTPTVGATVNAYVGDTHCGVGQTVDTGNGTVGYRVIVYAAPHGGLFTGCGASGRTVRIEIDGQTIELALPWSIDWINSPGRSQLYLPVIARQ